MLKANTPALLHHEGSAGTPRPFIKHDCQAQVPGGYEAALSDLQSHPAVCPNLKVLDRFLPGSFISLDRASDRRHAVATCGTDGRSLLRASAYPPGKSWLVFICPLTGPKAQNPVFHACKRVMRLQDIREYPVGYFIVHALFRSRLMGLALSRCSPDRFPGYGRPGQGILLRS